MSGKLLKLLTGPHQGAEVDLPQGTTTLGSSPDCDLILDDNLLADKHLAFTVEGGGSVRVRFLKPGFVDLRPIEAGREVEVPDCQPISVGTTCLGIGPDNEPWPSMTPPDWAKLGALPVSDAPALSNGETKNKGSAAAAGNTPTGGPAGQRPENSRSSELPAGESFDSEPALPRKTEVRPARHFAVVAGVLVVLLAAAATGYSMIMRDSSTAVGGAAPPAPDVSGELAALAEKYGLSLKSKDGTFQISGLTATSEERETIARNILTLAPTALCEVYSHEQITEAATAVLHGFKYDVTAAFDESGALHLSGWAPSEVDWKRALVRLRHDVPGSVTLTEEVRFFADISTRMAGDLERNGLSSVRLMLENGALKCNGKVPEDNAAKWNDLIAEWRADYPVIREVVDDTVLVAAGSGTLDDSANEKALLVQGVPLPGPIVSTMMSPVPCFKTADGSVFFEGATLGDGFVVGRIESGGITFERGDSETRVYSLLNNSPSPASAPQTEPRELEAINDAQP